MFIAAAAGGGIICRASHGNYSDYSDYRDHSNHSQYGDSALISAINDKEYAVNIKTDEVNQLRRDINDNFERRIEELKREKKLFFVKRFCAPDEIIDQVKVNIKQEIEDALENEKQKLAKINFIIKRINELELQAKQR